MVGIKDIAKRAGVAISTVSYALNGSPQVSEKTRQRILAIAEELHYVPNRAGQNLRKKSSSIIGVYLTNYQGSFYSDVLEGMLETAKEKDYDLITCSGNRSRLFLPQGLIDGALVLDANYPDKEILEYAGRGKPIVVMDRKIEHNWVRQVQLDNRYGTKLAIETLLKEACQEVFLITGPKENFDSIERLRTAENLLKQAGMKYSIIEGKFTEASGIQATKDIISAAAQFPIGIFALNDEMALGVYSYLQGTSYKIGRDVLLVGFDGIQTGKFTKPTLATITFDKRDWGRAAVETLLRLLDGEDPSNRLISTTLQAGESLPASLDK